MYQFYRASFPLGKMESHRVRPPLPSLDDAALTAEDETWQRDLAGRGPGH
jgi:hypothetical protein